MNTNLEDFYQFYVKNCKNECMNEAEFYMNFPSFLNFVQMGHMNNTQDIPVLFKNGKSIILNLNNIVKKVYESK